MTPSSHHTTFGPQIRPSDPSGPKRTPISTLTDCCQEHQQHAMIMIFFFIMPATMAGLGNLLLPIMLSTPEMVFPKVNNLGVSLLVPPRHGLDDVYYRQPLTDGHIVVDVIHWHVLSVFMHLRESFLAPRPPKGTRCSVNRITTGAVSRGPIC